MLYDARMYLVSWWNYKDLATFAVWLSRGTDFSTANRLATKLGDDGNRRMLFREAYLYVQAAIDEIEQVQSE